MVTGIHDADEECGKRARGRETELIIPVDCVSFHENSESVCNH